MATTKHHITLTPDEIRRVLALEPGEAMTLTRAFDPQPQKGFVLHYGPNPTGRYIFRGEIKGETAFFYAKPPPGQPGDVLVCPVICVDDERQYRPMPPPEHSYGVSPTYSFRLTVVSVTPRLDGETWVVDAGVRKEK